jgi:hypothetical protein
VAAAVAVAIALGSGGIAGIVGAGIAGAGARVILIITPAASTGDGEPVSKVTVDDPASVGGSDASLSLSGGSDSSLSLAGGVDASLSLAEGGGGALDDSESPSAAAGSVAGATDAGSAAGVEVVSSVPGVENPSSATGVENPGEAVPESVDEEEGEILRRLERWAVLIFEEVGGVAAGGVVGC